MNNLPFVPLTIIPVKVMTQVIVQIPALIIHQIDPLVLKHFQFHYHVIDLVLDIFSLIKSSNLTQLHHLEDAVKVLNTKEILEIFFIFPPEIVVTVIFLGPILEIDSMLKSSFLRIDLHQDHVQDLHPHLEEL